MSKCTPEDIAKRRELRIASLPAPSRINLKSPEQIAREKEIELIKMVTRLPGKPTPPTGFGACVDRHTEVSGTYRVYRSHPPKKL